MRHQPKAARSVPENAASRIPYWSTVLLGMQWRSSMRLNRPPAGVAGRAAGNEESTKTNLLAAQHAADGAGLCDGDIRLG